MADVKVLFAIVGMRVRSRTGTIVESMFRFVALTQVGPFHEKVKDWPSKVCIRKMGLL
jgi:hypothetical protein